MATYSRRLLSGSTSGKPIKVTGTSSGASVTVHTAISGDNGWDELYIWASNTSSSDATLTIEWGGTTDPDNLLVKGYVIPANCPPMPVATGQVLNGGLVCKAFAGTANVLVLAGFCNRIA